MSTAIIPGRRLLLLVLAILIMTPVAANAHCDTLDGPVVKAARNALRTRNINFVLIWIRGKDESELKTAFRQTLIVRRLNRDARELADKYFFETVVRLHRAGEGEPYTGLKPAGIDLGPVIPVADKAIESQSATILLGLFGDGAKNEIAQRFSDVIRKKQFDQNDVAAGREYVAAYVSFLQYLERLYETKSG
jgi:uncharacterized protein DUF6448